ncbi:LptF/LptG family permease [Sneathiella sp. DP05]|uniref:LptF/LptG family permease n=2 Tax=Sneathiella litorea TaxID=2606216 RepID=A0A6L8W773_9PROT|nr:LptF/LptG family permease [Sneathiella litorea]
MLFITFSLTGVIWLSQSLKFVEKLINGLPVSTFLYLSLLLLPEILRYTLLLGLFFGTLFAFNKLYSDSELIVMWAAGLSKSALAKPAIYLALIIALIMYFLGFLLVPYGNRTVTELRVAWQDSLAAVVLREGVFNSLAAGVTVYVREKTSTGEMLGILVHDERVPEKPVTYMAERGAFVKTEEGPRFVMHVGNLQEVSKDDAKLSLLYFDQYTLDISQFEKKSGARWLSPEHRYIWELINPEDSERVQQEARKLNAELHQRIVLPFYAVALVFIALAGVMGGEFSRRGRSRRMTVAAAAGVLLLISAMALFRATAQPALVTTALYLLPVLISFAAAYLASGRQLWFLDNKIAPDNLANGEPG